jgi:hypothetical protein
MSRKNGPSIVTNGLVLYLDAANRQSYTPGSTTWTDVSNNANNGTLTNGPTFSSTNGGSIVFDGANDYVTGNISNLNSWTMTLWYLAAGISGDLVYYPFSCTSTSTGLGFGGTFSASTRDRWYFFDGTNTLSNSNTSVVINTWYNLVVTKTSTTYNLYTNGNLSLNTTGVDLSYTQYNLGRRGDGVWYANGRISQALLYNRALSAQEVLQNYNTTKTRFGL